MWKFGGSVVVINCDVGGVEVVLMLLMVVILMGDVG